MSRVLRGSINKDGEFEHDFDINELTNLTVSIIGIDGKEYPSPRREFVDDVTGRPSSIEENVARCLRRHEEIKRSQGFESLEEADDLEDIDEFENDIAISKYDLPEVTLTTEDPTAEKKEEVPKAEPESVIEDPKIMKNQLYYDGIVYNRDKDGNFVKAGPIKESPGSST